MALTPDQKKYLLGGGIGALTLAVGHALLDGRAAHASSLPHHHPHHAHDRGARDGDRVENERGEYGHKKHRHRHEERGHDQ
jgi:hypothetical protein